MMSSSNYPDAAAPGVDADGWNPHQRTLRSDIHAQDHAKDGATVYGGAGSFHPDSSIIRSGQGLQTGAPAQNQGYEMYPPQTGTGTGRSHVQIASDLPNPRGARPHQHTHTASSIAYPPGYSASGDGSSAFYSAGNGKGIDPSERLASMQATPSEPGGSRRPDPQTYKSTSSAEWSRLLGRAGYAVAPSNEDGTGGADWPSRSQAWRGPHSKPSPSFLCCVSVTGEVIGKLITILIVAGLLWVPGIVALTAYNAGPRNNYNGPLVWKVSIFWWSVWLSSIWVGWFVAHYIAKLIPRLLGGTVGAVYIEIKHYIQYLTVLSKYIALVAWTILVWISWLAVIWNNYQDPARFNTPASASPDSTTSGLAGLDPNSLFNSTAILGDTSVTSTYNVMVTLTHLWFGLIICALLLLVEKFFIQVIALSFHRVSYEDRLAQNKLHVEIFTTLYDHALRNGVTSSAASSRPGTPTKGPGTLNPTRVEGMMSSKAANRRSIFAPDRFSRTMRRSRPAPTAENSNSIMGVVASELGTEQELAARDFRLRFKNGVLIPTKTSPRTAVLMALHSSNETRKLSYRIFRAFSHWQAVEDGTDEVERVMEFQDINKFFHTAEAARVAWELLDKNFNGSVNEDEMLSAGQEIHRERDGLMSSMRDIDSAVGRLDQVFMSFFGVISVVIVAGLISVRFSSLVTSFGTVLLGLSWLLSSTAQEALSAIIFLFVKHPYDVGDRVEIDAGSGSAIYVVAEIQLLSTIFKTVTGKYVQISHSVLTSKSVVNLRRSGPIEETVTFEVPYSTNFEAIEQLRERMMAWIATQPRDFFPGLNIAIVDLPEFKSMKLSTGIRYKSNWQAGALKTTRKNRWMCRFKEVLAETGIVLPDEPSTTRVTLIPYPAPEAESTKPTPAEALASTRGASGEAREYRFLDDAAAADAKVLETRSVRQRPMEEGYSAAAAASETAQASSSGTAVPGGQGTELRSRRPQNGDMA